MAHHSDKEIPEELLKDFGDPQGLAFRKLLGPTGGFPHGKITATDEGEIAFAVGHLKSKGVVVIDFNKPVTWVGMRPEEAIQLAVALVTHAENVRFIGSLNEKTTFKAKAK